VKQERGQKEWAEQEAARGPARSGEGRGQQEHLRVVEEQRAILETIGREREERRWEEELSLRLIKKLGLRPGAATLPPTGARQHGPGTTGQPARPRGSRSQVGGLI
jgi:hypothetical protein